MLAPVNAQVVLPGTGGGTGASATPAGQKTQVVPGQCAGTGKMAGVSTTGNIICLPDLTGGGGGTPGGDPNSVQFNDAGAFGGFGAWDGTTLDLSTFRVQAAEFRTDTVNPANNGSIRFAASDFIAWRNQANSANINLTKDSSDRIASSGGFAGNLTGNVTGNLTGTASAIAAGSIDNADKLNASLCTEGQILKRGASVWACAADATGGGGGAFTDLTDTPANYTSAANKLVKVNATPDALEYSDVTVSGTTITATLSGNASTATALAANGANCSAGQFPLGVDASGAAESCTALPTTIAGTANEVAASAATGAVTLSLPATLALGTKVLLGGTPLVFEGATADEFETTVVVTDPTADRNFTIPNADSVAVQPDTGAADNFLTGISALGIVSKAQPAFSNLSGSATAGQVPNLEDLNGTLEVTSGGTGAATAGDARTNLGAAAQADLDTHTNDVANPHAVTKAQVGLGSVENYAIASQSEAEAGTVNNKYMTPLRVAEYVATALGEPVGDPLENGTSVPGTCTVTSPPARFYRTGATSPGLYECLTEDVWTLAVAEAKASGSALVMALQGKEGLITVTFDADGVQRLDPQRTIEPIDCGSEFVKKVDEFGVATCAAGGGGMGYEILLGNAAALATNADSTTYYAGDHHNALTTYSTVAREILKACTIKSVRFRWSVNGTGPSSEEVTLFLRINDTTNIASTNVASTTNVTATVTGLSTALVATDTIAYGITTPAWATNPTNTFFRAAVYCE